eukprot:1389540-Lingulodinium_polyedra.AAC.1
MPCLFQPLRACVPSPPPHSVPPQMIICHHLFSFAKEWCCAPGPWMGARADAPPVGANADSLAR